MSKFTSTPQAEQFYAEHKGKPFFSDLTAFMQSDVVTGMELVKENAVASFRDLVGPTQTSEAKTNVPGTLRAMFGTDGMRNAVHGSSSSADYNNEKSQFFSRSFGPTAAFNNCTCCIIKPHVV